MASARSFRTSKTSLLRCAYGSASAIALLSIGHGAWAQAAAPKKAAAAPNEVEEVLVTASRVERDGFSAPTPTTVLNLQALQNTGATNVADVLNTLPSFRATNTPTTNTLNATAGSNYPDLRGMGPTRTLVLLDRRRYVPTSDSNLVDLNVVPTALIERVDVVTGGASAAWGSDAVAGVVNVILRSKFEGLRGDIEGGVSQRGDNGEYRVGLGFGTSFAGGRGHLLIGGELYASDGISRQGSRKWGQQGWQLISNPLYAPGNGQYQQLIVPNVHMSNATAGGVIVSGPLAGTQFGPGGQPTTFTYGSPKGSSFMIGGDGLSLGPVAPLKDSNDRQNVLVRAQYDVTPDVEATVEGSYARFAGDNPILSPFDFGTIRIAADNAYLPAATKAQMTALGLSSFQMGRISFDMGQITTRNETEVERGLVALKGKLGDGWTWDGYVSYGRTLFSIDLYNNPIVARKTLATDAVLDPATGRIVCRSTLTSPTNGCVPLNLIGPDAAQPAALAYILGDSQARTEISQKVAAFNIQGEPFSLWAGPVSVAAGLEYRKDTLKTASDTLSQSNAFLTGNFQPLSGERDVKEGYVEAVAPLLANQPFAKRLDLNLAARLTNYSLSGQVTTWKVGSTYAVNDDLTFRASLSRDIRAPNLTELFQSQAITFATVFDPVKAHAVTIRQIRVGNRNLQPELSKNLTIGAVYQPSWLPGARISVDYYKIQLEDAVSLLPIQSTIDRCNAGNTALCGFINRDSAGEIASITRTQVNLAKVITSGVDLEAVYSTPLSRFVEDWGGNISLRVLGNHTTELSNDDLITKIDRAGDLSAGAAGMPKWRWNASVTYDRGPFTAFVQAQYISGGKYDGTLKGFALNDNSIPAVTYLDATLRYAVINEGSRKLEVFGTVNNLLDKDPPIVASSFFVPLATNPSLYDVVGRMFHVGVRFSY